MISIARSALSAALDRVAAVLPSKMILPILSGVRITPLAGGLRFEATNLEQWLETNAQAAGASKDMPAFVVPAKRLQEIVRSLSTGTVDLQLNEAKKRLVVKAGRGKFELPLLALDEFPAPTKDATPLQFTVDVGAFTQGLGRTVKFVSDAPSRPTLHGVLLQSDDRGVRLLATDGESLLMWPVSETVPVCGEWIIPAQAVRAIGVLGEGGPIGVSVGPQSARFSGSEGTMQTRLIEGPYPDVSRFFTFDAECTVDVDRIALSAAAKRVGAFEADGGVSAVDLDISASTIVLADAGSQEGSGRDEVPCASTGVIALRVKAGNLTGALDNVATKGSQVRLTVTGTNKPIYCESAAPEDVGRRALVMPLNRPAA